MSEERGKGSGCLFPIGGDFLPLFALMLLDDEERRRMAEELEEEEDSNNDRFRDESEEE